MSVYKNISIIYSFILLLLLSGCGEFIGFDELDQPDLGDVPKIELFLSQESMNRLSASVTDGSFAHALYRKEGRVYDSWIRVRGDLSRAFSKNSFTLKFISEGREDQRFSLYAAYKDPSFLRYRLAFDAYRFMGLPAPECKSAALFINDSYMGYYTKITLYSESDLRAVYGKSELFKCKFQSMGNDYPVYYLSDKEFPDDNDFSNLGKLILYAKNLSDSEWLSFVEEKVDIENAARYLFVHNFLAVTDTSQKNFNILYNGRYYLLPWDHEANMRRNYRGNLVSSDPYPFEGNNMLMRRLLMEGSPVRERYIVLFKDEVSTGDLRTYLKNKLTEYYAEIGEAVRHDRNKYFSYEMFVQDAGPLGVIETFLDERAGEVPDWLK